ncbi:uncharacterized protein MONOS_13467 [Monocercomonoides exilis]|uniref:uncharacterized protein n=1 Tax=Monocercomonoides exilis TaxID=2049356 RepID=UPI0035594B9B|nr:hypothetical protein MONOS_13467 [Monocercomonoides exilis]|eukprot:MONOS_13467.1-p1 / transcript=MONOS_13467.1 / gene=MONOS_13467 / organism=Monocercomonoides_exilis_PA203 / gene_product=unspecified product / transcript_product=unspecified product / location=Mono_scaffold00833:9841-11343(-) / protein_length=453 / sequence_SO=supercontig / SO=protein_coding / is_pseudo=false
MEEDRDDDFSRVIKLLEDAEFSRYENKIERCAHIYIDHGIKKCIIVSAALINRSALNRAIEAVKDGRDCFVKGRPPALNKEKTAIFKEELSNSARDNKHKTMKEARLLASSLIQNKPKEEIIDHSVCRSWAYNVIKKSEDLLFKTPVQIPAARIAHSTQECIGRWFDRLAKLYHDHNYLPQLVFNLDECYITSEERKIPKVITTTDAPAPMQRQQSHPQNTSLLIVIAADGTHQRTCMIFSGKNVPKEYKMANSRELLIIPAETASMTKERFEYIFRNSIIPAIEYRRSSIEEKYANALIHMDSLHSHVTSSIISLASKHRIDLALPPSHSSHLIQPLDKYVNANLKSKLGESDTDVFIDSAEGRRTHFIRRLQIALHHALSPATVIASWRDSGMWPLNKKLVCDSLPLTKPDNVIVSPFLMDKTKESFSGRIYLSSDPFAPFSNGLTSYMTL